MRREKTDVLRREIQGICRKNEWTIETAPGNGTSHAPWIVRNKSGEVIGKWVWARGKEVSQGTLRSTLGALEFQLEMRVKAGHRLSEALANLIDALRKVFTGR